MAGSKRMARTPGSFRLRTTTGFTTLTPRPISTIVQMVAA
jgi:hypothetical protein